MNTTTTIRKWFDEFTAASGENIECVVLGYDGNRHIAQEWPTVRNGELVQFRDLGEEILDHEFDDDYGVNNSPNLCAWSPSWVLFSDNYDGSETLRSMPRYPVAHQPLRPGGG